MHQTRHHPRPLWPAGAAATLSVLSPVANGGHCAQVPGRENSRGSPAQPTTTPPNEVQITAGPGPEGAGVLIRGTDEFAGLIGTYNETLRVEDIDAGGVTHGHIKLVTRLAQEL